MRPQSKSDSRNCGQPSIENTDLLGNRFPSHLGLLSIVEENQFQVILVCPKLDLSRMEFGEVPMIYMREGEQNIFVAQDGIDNVALAAFRPPDA